MVGVLVELQPPAGLTRTVVQGLGSCICGFFHMANLLASWYDGRVPRSIPRASIVIAKKQKLPGQLRFKPETGAASLLPLLSWSK